jgi:O-antigen ligase
MFSSKPSRSHPGAKPGWRERFDAPTLLPGLTVGFFALVLLLGGSARADTASLLLLRPMTVLVLGYALVHWLKSPATGLGMPICAFALLAALALLQLVPLPPQVWTALPGREPLIGALEAARVPLGWQPLSVVPMATLNALGALLVPIAGLILLAIADEETRYKALLLLIGFMLASAALGLLQAIAPSQSILYLYRITNDGYPVGLFANRNHQAVMLAAIIPLVLAYGERLARERGAAFLWLGRIVAIGLVGLCIMTGSRAGSVLAIGAFIVAATLFADARIAATPYPSQRRDRLALLVLPLAVLLGLVGIALSGAGAAFERLADKDSFDDLRFQILPDLFAMVRDAMPLGWGFGTFPEVFEIYERREMIQPFYVNHAHNDWLEMTIEGGLAAPAIMLALALWVARTAWSKRHALLRPRDHASRLTFSAFAAILILVAGSLFDYPLRTPAGALALVIFLAILAAPKASSQGNHGG